MIIAGTGHRPKWLPCGYDESHPWAIKVKQELDLYLANPVTQPEVIISGMALGWDTWLAEAAITNGIILWAYCGFHDQDNKWPKESRIRFRNLVNKAERVIFAEDKTSNELGHYSEISKALRKRDNMMVQDSDKIVALWNPDHKSGGTYHTVSYANRLSKPIKNFWNE